MGKKRIGIIWALALTSVLLSGPMLGQTPPTSSPETPASPPTQPWQPTETPANRLPLAPTQTPTIAPLDPAERIEPAAIELTPGNQPISQFMALTMHQELANLIGRFESAQLMVVSQDQSTPVAMTERLSASVNPIPAPAASPELEAARTLLDEWFDLIDAGEYAIARERWQQARQSLWDGFPTQKSYAQPEVRAVWLDRGTIVEAKNRAGLAQVFDQLARAGFNTVFLETVNAGFPVYPSHLAPQNPLTIHWDPLKAAVELAHERNMELHAWVWTFAAGNQVHNRILNLTSDFEGPMLAIHPNWVGYDNRGNPIPPGQTKPFYDPANQELRTFLLRLFSEIITEYDVDGLQLDYIRYPFQDPGGNRTYGYGQDARWRFQAATGVDPIELTPRPDPNASHQEQQRQVYLWNRWTEFRVQQVNTFVLQVSQMVRRQRPDITLSAAVFAKHPAGLGYLGSAGLPRLGRIDELRRRHQPLSTAD